MGADELLGFALGAKPEILELHHHDDGVIVIGLDEVDRAARNAGLVPERGDVLRPTAAQLNPVRWKRIMMLDGCKDARKAKAEVTRTLFVHHQKGFSARARHHAVE